jgi:hypothetical protein
MNTTKFGKLTILKEYNKKFLSETIKYCRCRCDCGKICDCQKTLIITGKRTSCCKGNCHPQVLKMLGRTFGDLTVLSHFSRKKGYKCRCICGKETIARTFALKNATHNSCGCTLGKRLAKLHTLPNFQSLKNSLYRHYKRAAKNRNYIFELTKEEFEKLTQQNCYYCGLPPSMVWRSRPNKYTNYSNYPYNGVDRIDNTIGYITDNCVGCCRICNNSKSTLSVNDWFIWLKRIVKFQNI